MDFIKRLKNALPFGPEETKDEDAVRIGILGAAKVANYALVAPARQLKTVKLHAVAARDRQRADKFAKRYRLPKSYATYQELIEDPEVDAVYVALPNGLHGHWSKKAVQAGKHVLCEKPFAANAKEARGVMRAARRRRRVCREAFHYREHELFRSARQVVDSGQLGNLVLMQAQFSVPRWAYPWQRNDIRFSPQLAGGALMDPGCYCVSLIRGLLPKPVRSRDLRVRYVVSNTSTASPQFIDTSTFALLHTRTRRPLQARLYTSLGAGLWPCTTASLIGSRATMNMHGFLWPFLYNRLQVVPHEDAVAARSSPNLPARQHRMAPGILDSNRSRGWAASLYGDGRTTYYHQLQRFAEDVQAIQGKLGRNRRRAALRSMKQDREDAVQNMQLIDAIYRFVGLPLRSPTPVYD